MKDQLPQKLLEDLAQFRKTLHQRPELSGQEKFTPHLILDFLGSKTKTEVLSNLGGNGMAIVYDSKTKGPTTVFRCELDALPIQESNTFAHKSKTEGVAHKCGHDGHMTIVAGLGKLLNKEGPEKGKVVLLFQPAEETGTGAEAVLKDKRFTDLNPDYVYALHNVPQLKENGIYIKSGTFSAASTGMTVKLFGATAHAAEPENGKSPAIALAEIIKQLATIPAQKQFKALTLVTVVHALLGKIAFGVSPGYAEVRATLRAYLQEDIDKLVKEAEKFIHTIAREEQLKVEISYSEVFPETSNNEEAVSIIKQCANQTKIPLERLDHPLKWSEDFGHFLLKYKGAIFALGAGEDTPKLHSHDYDFPEALLPTGVLMFHALVKHHNH